MDKHEFEKVIKACRFCLMCRHLCTVGNITYAETNTPRGHALMIDCMGSEALRDTPENRKRAAEVFFSCCYCGHCQSNCVSSYRHPDAIMAARASVGDEDLPGRVAKLRRLVEKTGECYAAPAQAAGLRDASGGALRRVSRDGGGWVNEVDRTDGADRAGGADGAAAGVAAAGAG